jgi:hypothetical protein
MIRLVAILAAALLGYAPNALAQGAAWSPLVFQGERFTLAAPARVRYGIDVRWIERTLAAGAHECTDATFGDPAPFMFKACQLAQVAAPPVLPPAVVVPPCYPYEAAARAFTVRTNPAGAAFFTAGPDASFALSWWCQGPYSATGRFVVGLKSDLAADFATRVGTFLTGDKAAKDALYRASISCNAGDSACARYAPLIVAAREQLAATRPPVVVWRVRDNPSGTTRPVFPVTAGVRSTTATRERVAEGAECLCTTTAIVEGASTYCSVAGLPNVSLVPTPRIDYNRVSLCAP